MPGQKALYTAQGAAVLFVTHKGDGGGESFLVKEW